MACYLLVDTKLNDPEGYEAYKAKAKPIVESYGGKYLARGGELEVLEDDLWSPTRLVIIEFPDKAAAMAFANSDEYAPVRALRHQSADCTLVLVEGI